METKTNQGSQTNISENPQLPSREDLLEVWKAAMDMWNAEADRYWMRSNIFLLLNGGLLVIVTIFVTNVTMRTLIVTLAAILAYLWMRVSERGKFYMDRWKPILIQLEKQISIEIIGVLPGSPERKTVRASTTYMRYAIFVFLLMYCVLLGISLVSIMLGFDVLGGTCPPVFP